MTYFDFVVRKEHSKIRNIFDEDELVNCKEIKTLQNYYDNFKLFLQIVLLLNNSYPSESDIEDISDNCIVDFVEENEIESFQEPYLEISNMEIKNISFSKKKQKKNYPLQAYQFCLQPYNEISSKQTRN